MEEPKEPFEVLGYAEIAAILGFTRQRAVQLAKNHKDFPAPFAMLSGRPLYLRGPVEKFAKEWDRRSGRPPKQGRGEGNGQMP